MALIEREAEADTDLVALVLYKYLKCSAVSGYWQLELNRFQYKFQLFLIGLEVYRRFVSVFVFYCFYLNAVWSSMHTLLCPSQPTMSVLFFYHSSFFIAPHVLTVKRSL